MIAEQQWIIVRIDGKIASISTDCRLLSSITAKLAKDGNVRFNEITARTVSFSEVWKLRESIRWEDLMLFGTDFQKKVWKKLWELTHPDHEDTAARTSLISYSDFADLCQNRAGVRAVAHAIGLNPASILIPCHLVIPKESIDKIDDIKRKAEATIFKGDDLCINSILNDNSIDFGEYALGRKLKRELIKMELA